MFRSVKEFVKTTPLALPYIYLKSWLVRPRTQNEEYLIIDRLIKRFDIPRCFIEFGFGGWEFNCARLAFDWDGLLLDSDPYNTLIARTILPRRVISKNIWITMDSLSIIHEYSKDREIGILSIDVDGNDYWFLENVISIRPALIIVEYNSAFGLRPISIPYDSNFHFTKYAGLSYSGASLTAFSFLATRNGYSLIEVANSGVNAFFVRKDLLRADDRPLDPQHAYREALHWDGYRSSEHWERMKHLPFIDVTEQ